MRHHNARYKTAQLVLCVSHDDDQARKQANKVTTKQTNKTLVSDNTHTTQPNNSIETHIYIYVSSIVETPGQEWLCTLANLAFSSQGRL
jgi:hypothetical protein